LLLLAENAAEGSGFTWHEVRTSEGQVGYVSTTLVQTHIPDDATRALFESQPEPATPIVESQPEPTPVIETSSTSEPAPIVESEPAPIVESQSEPTPIVEIHPEPEPAPIVETQPEPTSVIETASEPEPEPISESQPEPAPIIDSQPEPVTPVVETASTPEPEPIIDATPIPNPTESGSVTPIVTDTLPTPVLEAEAPQPMIDSPRSLIVTGDSVNLRREPKVVRGNEIGSVKRGAIVQLLNETIESADGRPWVQIRTETGLEGYSAAEFYKPYTEPETPAAPVVISPVSDAPRLFLIAKEENIRIRAQPINGTVLGAVKKGERVEVIEDYEGALEKITSPDQFWVMVRTPSGVEGYTAEWLYTVE
ncbi:MAG: SH3 domain-containing protein, partial [Anaerolineae bacterium]|nr:SH3 domain-containing protein [Anaerolineae bacterium]